MEMQNNNEFKQRVLYIMCTCGSHFAIKRGEIEYFYEPTEGRKYFCKCPICGRKVIIPKESVEGPTENTYIITKENFKDAWKDSSKDDILDQFFYEHIRLHNLLQRLTYMLEEFEGDD